MEPFDPERALCKIRREFGEHGGVSPSISRSSTFTVMDPSIMPDIFHGSRSPEKGGYYLYSRHFNPTVDVLSREMAALENTEAAICTASGMSAISSVLLQLCKTGSHIISSDCVYGGTHALMEHLLPSLGITTTFVDINDFQAVESAITPETRAIFTESVGNPMLKVADIPHLAAISREKGIKLVVDNTFSPVIITPSLHGADIVVHSLTKFINGASDVIAGAICGSKDFVFQLMDLHKGCVMLLGPTMDSRVAFDIQQRLPHLPVRIKEHSKRAMAMAQLLANRNAKVIYPGLTTHPNHDLIKSIMNIDFGFGGILALDCGTLERAERFISILQNKERFGLIAVSLGYFDTLMSISGASTASEISVEDQQKIGILPGLVRMSIGITGSLNDRLNQIETAAKDVGLI